MKRKKFRKGTPYPRQSEEIEKPPAVRLPAAFYYIRRAKRISLSKIEGLGCQCGLAHFVIQKIVEIQ